MIHYCPTYYLLLTLILVYSEIKDQRSSLLKTGNGVDEKLYLIGQKNRNPTDLLSENIRKRNGFKKSTNHIHEKRRFSAKNSGKDKVFLYQYFIRLRAHDKIIIQYFVVGLE